MVGAAKERIAIRRKGEVFLRIALGGVATLLGDDTGELVDLALGAAEGTEALLGQLASLLVLGVADQLHDAPLVRGKADDLADRLDERGALGLLSLAVRGLDRLGDDGGRVSAVEAPGEVGTGSGHLYNSGVAVRATELSPC